MPQGFLLRLFCFGEGLSSRCGGVGVDGGSVSPGKGVGAAMGVSVFVAKLALIDAVFSGERR